MSKAPAPYFPLSSIRTMTVGSGITPDLLTLVTHEALAGLQETLLTAGGEFRPALRTT
jgi:hypothetical protein